MAQSFIGAYISLTSISNIRYRGILTGINHAESTIQLKNVRSMGTEDRLPPEDFLAENPTPYEYIVFRATEVKDLAIEKNPPTANHRSVHDDPAVLGASASTGPSHDIPPSASEVTPPVTTFTAGVEDGSSHIPKAEASNSNGGGGRQGRAHQLANGTERDRSSASVRSAEASLDTVERALGDLRVGAQSHSHHGGERRGGRGRGGHHQSIRGPGVVPETPFDFARSNAKFDKESLAPSNASTEDTPNSPDSSSATTLPAPSAFYSKTKSFFDDISSDAKARSTGETPGGPGIARSRREEERNRNMSTFGETGVQWNGNQAAGHGRRGGRRKYQGGGNRAVSTTQ